jgi:hypothetical protein
VTNNPGQGRIERTLAAILARPLWLRFGNMAAVWKLIAEPNAGVSDRQVPLRTGIDLGDALIDGDDILGEDVNIAAWVESMASRPNFSIAAYLDGASTEASRGQGKTELGAGTRPITAVNGATGDSAKVDFAADRRFDQKRVKADDYRQAATQNPNEHSHAGA